MKKNLQIYNKPKKKEKNGKLESYNGIVYDRIQINNKDEEVNSMGFLNCKIK